MARPLRVLLIEDSKADAELLLARLREGSYDPTFERVDTAEGMSEALDRRAWDVILADHAMPRFTSVAALALLKAKGIDAPFIIVSGQIGEDVAVASMKSGASDYLMKGNLTRLVPAIERELREAVIRRERRQAEEDRDRLMRQLREVNEQLVVSSIQSKEQADEVLRRAAEVDAIFEAMAEGLMILSLIHI